MNSKKKKLLQRQQERSALKAKLFKNALSSTLDDKSINSLRKRKAKTVSEKTKKIKLENEINHNFIDLKTERKCFEVNKAEEEEIKSKMRDWGNLNVPPLVLKSLSEFGFNTPMPIQKQVSLICLKCHCIYSIFL